MTVTDNDMHLTLTSLGCLQCDGFIEIRSFTDNEAVVQSNQQHQMSTYYKLSVATVHHTESTMAVTAIYNLGSQLISESPT